MDSLIDRYFTTVPHADRMTILGQAVNILSSQVVVLGMFWDIGPTMMSKRLTGVSTPATSGTPTSGT